MEYKKLIQQGDVLIKKIECIPNDLRAKDPTDKGHVLAEGEMTGHAHRILDASKAEFYESKNGTLYLRIKEGVDITHEEHAPVKVDVGDYQIGIVREYDHVTKQARQVAD